MNRDVCLEILRNAGCNSEVIQHSVAVADLALEICDTRWKDLADHELIEAGALLHDIGRSRTQGIHHAVVGAAIGRELGLDPRLVLIIERHIGAGITQDEAEALGLPAKDYLPETIEEKIVAHADNLVDGTDRITFDERIRQVEEKLTASHVNRMIKLHNEVCGREPDIAIFWGFANIKDVKYLMNEISKLEQDHNLTIQIVGAAFVAGEGHVISAVKKAIRSMDAGEAIASSLSLEILLYLAGTRNISKALKIGVKEGRSDVVVLIIGDTIEDGIKEKVFELLSFEPSAIASFDEGRRNRLIEFFEITAEELASVGENKLEKLVMERVALLDLTK